MSKIKSRVKKTIRDVLFMPTVKRSIDGVPVISRVYSSVHRRHPIDKLYGISTSGYVPSEEIHPGPNIHPYLGSQPSIVRRTIQALGDVNDYVFVDLGCGKGRAITVASEFPFREVLGVELSVDLAQTARMNTANVARRFPQRPKITIVEDNIVDFPFPPGKVVFFTYHAVGLELMTQVARRFESSLAMEQLSHLFFIYYNPVLTAPFDASSALRRFYVEQLPYDKSEVGFGPDRDDVVAIWQSIDGAVLAPHVDAARPVIAANRLRARLAG